MKKIHIFCLLTLLLFAATACKKEKWIDWKVQNTVWLASNGLQEGVITTPTGLQYKVIRQGIASSKPDALKSVRVNYTGKLITGDVFEQGEDVSLKISDLILGMAEGLKKMNLSGHYIFYIPQELGYGSDTQGAAGYSTYIPPYSTLIFDVELLEIY